MGASGLESDVWVTSDGVAVLDHDGTVGGRVRKSPIARVGRVDLPPHIPALTEVVASLGSAFEFSLDVKDDAAVPALATAVESSGFPQPQLWLCSPRINVLELCRQNLPAARLVHSIRHDRIKVTLERHVASLAGSGIDALNMHHSDWNGGRVTLCHRFGIHAFAWDIQQPDQMTTALRMGMDAVYSDSVDMMMAEVLSHLTRERGS